MKVYPDANIYITYLLGQKGEALCDRFFKQGLSCRFTLVVSKTVLAEAAARCGENGIMLLQKHMDDYLQAKKIEIVERTAEELAIAMEIDERTGKKYGRNDMLHAILARKYADVFITNDSELASYASKTVKTFSLVDFLRSKSETL